MLALGFEISGESWADLARVIKYTNRLGKPSPRLRTCFSITFFLVNTAFVTLNSSFSVFKPV